MKLLLAIAFVVTVNSSLLADFDGKSSHHWWLNSYGQVTKEQNPAIERATRVFDKIWRASQPVSINKPELFFLPESSEKWLDSWAVTIADGSILLVESILPLSFESDHAEEVFGNSRLAFIISHEMAHLIHKDHEKLGVPLLFQVLTGEKELKIVREAELQADYHGLFLMTMAGYNPKNVLGRQTVFFDEYARKVRKKIRSVGSMKDKQRHPDNEERVDELRNRLWKFSGKLSQFNQGVESYLAGDLIDAEQFFRSFLAVYPGREVYNNLGLCLYQRSRIHVSACEELHYRLIPATMLAMKTDADRLIPEEISVGVEIRKKDRCRPDLFQQALKQARRFIIKALKKDDYYQPARINLTALQLSENDLKSAEAETEILLSHNPDNAHILNNKAISLYLMNAESNKTESIQLLESVSELSPVFEIAIKNINMIAPKINRQAENPMVKPALENQKINPEILQSIE